MKSILTSSIALLILIAASCKKETTAKANKIGGDYNMYEIEVQQPYSLTPLPTKDGETGKIVISLKNDSTASARVLLFNKAKDTVFNDVWNCKVTKDPDGDIVLKEGSDLVAYIWEDYDMDFYGYDNYRFGAKK